MNGNDIKDLLLAVVDMDDEPDGDVQPKDAGILPLIDPEMFFDLLMEQQEQM